MHNVRTFAAIELRASWHPPPCQVELRHPPAGGVGGDRFEDVITFDYLRFLYKIKDGLCGNLCPYVSDIRPKLLDKIDVIEE